MTHDEYWSLPYKERREIMHNAPGRNMRQKMEALGFVRKGWNPGELRLRESAIAAHDAFMQADAFDQTR